MPWIDVTEPYADPPKAVGPLTEPVDADGVDLDDRWGSIVGSVLTGGVDLGSCAQVEVRGSVFRGVSFRADPEVEFDVTASTFVDCDLSALRFTKLTNTRFEGCKLSGVDVSAGLLRDVVFERTLLKLSVLRMAELERVEFRDATIDDVDAYEASLAHVSMPGSVLRAVDLDKARFQAVDLRDAVELDIRSCRRFDGCLLAPEQLPALVHLFAEAAGVSVVRPGEE
ncbi:MAG: pentapeptide repeat-containing protein [Acidimicrobiales bacterium]